MVLPVSVGTGLSLLGDSALYTVLPLNLDTVGITLTSVGLLLSVNRIVRLLTNTPVGVLYDQWPRRRLFLPALYLGALSTAVYALSTGFWPMFVGRVCWGMAWTGIWVGGNTIILDISQDADRGRWVGGYQASFFLGAAGGALMGGVLTDLLGFHWAMAVAASLNLCGAVLATIALQETQPQPEANPQPAKRLQPIGTLETNASPAGELYTANALLGVNRLVVAGIVPATFGLFLAQQLGGSSSLGSGRIGVATLAGLGLGMSTLISTGAVPVVGRLSDRVRTRWQIVSAGLGLGILGFLLLALGLPWSIFCSLFFIAISSASNTSLSTTLVGDLSGTARRSRRLGVLYTVGDLGSAIGPPLAFGVLPLLGLQGLYLAMAGVLVVMFGVSIGWARRHPRSKA